MTVRDSGDGTFRILHAFADHGVEAEALSTLGTVYRYTIDPEPNPFVEETTQMDLMEDSPDRTFDLAVLHPSCAKYANMPGVDPDDHEDQIPRARELAREVADHYIIENRPNAPLADSNEVADYR